VTVHYRPETVEVVVGDDGRGFEPLGVVDKGGLGLLNMRERAERIGGSVAVDSAPGAGTTVRILAPVAPRPVTETVQQEES
jgi:signal transduction histidine kinase